MVYFVCNYYPPKLWITLWKIVGIEWVCVERTTGSPKWVKKRHEKYTNKNNKMYEIIGTYNRVAVIFFLALEKCG